MSYKQLDFLADSVNPILTVAFVILAIGVYGPKCLTWIARCGLALVIVELLARVIRKSHIVDSKGFPSTHCIWAFCVLTALSIVRPKFTPAAILIGIAYAWLNVYQHYHTPVDVLGALLGIPVAAACLLIARPKSDDQTPTSPSSHRPIARPT